MPILLAIGCNHDDEPTVIQPDVVSTSPINNATDISLNAIVEVRFNKEMNATTINSSTFTLFKGASQVAGIVSFSDSTAVFTPTVDLLPSSNFIATLTTGAKDTEGNVLENDYTFSFTSGEAPDTTVPSITMMDPIANATDVAFDKVVSVTFSEEMDASTVSATTFTLKQGSTVVSGTVGYTGTNATFTPATLLDAGLEYTATVSTGTKDLAGIALASDKVWSFTADALPAVTEVSPVNDALDVALSAKVTITFSEAMDATTITTSSFVVSQGTSAVVGVVTYADNTATFTPDAAFAAGLIYTAQVTVSVKNTNGHALAVAKTWAFTTDVLPTVTLVDPLDLATGVARNQAFPSHLVKR